MSDAIIHKIDGDFGEDPLKRIASLFPGREIQVKLVNDFFVALTGGKTNADSEILCFFGAYSEEEGEPIVLVTVPEDRLLDIEEQIAQTRQFRDRCISQNRSGESP